MTNEPQYDPYTIRWLSRHVGAFVREAVTAGVGILDACEKSGKAAGDLITKYSKKFQMPPNPVSQPHVEPPVFEPAEKAESEPVSAQPPLAEEEQSVEKTPEFHVQSEPRTSVCEAAPESSAEDPPPAEKEESEHVPAQLPLAAEEQFVEKPPEPHVQSEPRTSVSEAAAESSADAPPACSSEETTSPDAEQQPSRPRRRWRKDNQGDTYA